MKKSHAEGVDITSRFPAMMKGLPFFIPKFLKEKMLNGLLMVLCM